MRIQKWLLSATLAGSLAAGLGSAVAYGQDSLPNEPKPGTKADNKEDKTEAKQLRAQVTSDKAKLQTDRKQFGKKSSQVKSDQAQLRHDHTAQQRLHQDRTRDWRIERRRRNLHHGH